MITTNLIVLFSFILLLGLPIHSILAIFSSIKCLRYTEKENMLLCLIAVWIVPIFGSLAVLNNFIDEGKDRKNEIQDVGPV